MRFLILALYCWTQINIAKASVLGSNDVSSVPFKGSLRCSDSQSEFCPPGLFCVNSYCKCGVYPDNIISCNGTAAVVMRNYCVTFDKVRNATSVGGYLRPWNASKSGNFYGSKVLYHQLPRNIYHLNKEMCGSLNRTGTLCGSCKPDHYPLAYSFNMTCIPCPYASTNWLRYIMAAYLPLTLFYIIILFFKINTTSSHLFAVVYYCQTLSMPVLARNMFILIISDTNPTFIMAAKVFFSLYGIWNLDFFRPFYSNLCLGIGVLPTLALDYAVAIYPLFLIVISYFMIILYDKNYRVITILWSPFRFMFSLFRRKWDIRTSVIDAFATFFFLSNLKFLSVSFDLLIPTAVYELHPSGFNFTLGLFYSGDKIYFGDEHLPYAILSIVLLLVFVILPIIILVLYPFKFFQRFLNKLPIRRHILDTFTDSFQGCYKDGTEPGTRDYRWCASLFFIIRLFQFLLYCVTDKVIYNVLATMTLVGHIALFAILQPFKSSVAHYNSVNVVFLSFLTLFGMNAVGASVSVFIAPHYIKFFYMVGLLLGLSPQLYLIVGLFYCVYRYKMFGVGIVRRLKAWRSGYRGLPQENEKLPDRIENSDEYPRENLTNFNSTHNN